MLSLPASVRIYLFTGPTDMRKGFDGLGALVTASGLDVFSGHLFVFVSRRADRVKVLTWQRGGFVADCCAIRHCRPRAKRSVATTSD